MGSTQGGAAQAKASRSGTEPAQGYPSENPDIPKPMNPILATSLVSAGTNLLKRALTPGSQTQNQDPAFSEILDTKAFDIQKYMEDNGLTTADEVEAHIKGLKAQLLQSPHFKGSPMAGLSPSDVQISEQYGSYSLLSPGHQATIPQNTPDHRIAQTVHSLQNWANRQG
jgi:hypothetical protein